MESDLNGANAAVCHIVNNFNLFGFGSEESGLLQSIKELIENSIDASKISASSNSLPKEHHIFVRIGAVPNRCSVCLVEVSDDGNGISDPQSLLRCFNSSKESSPVDVHCSGRFGVGLSTALIYSLITTQIPMRLITKSGQCISACVADFTMDSSGSPKCVQSLSIAADGMSSGTTIRLHLPLNAATSEHVLNRGMYVCLEP